MQKEKNTLMLHFKRYFKDTEVKIFKEMTPTVYIMCSKKYSILLYSMFYAIYPSYYGCRNPKQPS